MAAEKTHFDGVAENFADYADTVRGYVRYELTHRNLAPFLGDTALRIADIGGGSGIDAAWLVGRGHEVVIVEPSEEQAAIAAKRKAELSEAEQSRLTIVTGEQATISELLKRDGSSSYDVTLSHGVAMYLDDSEAFIESLVALTKHGGHVSLLEKGFDGHLDRMRRTGELSRKIADFQYTHTVPRNNMERTVRAFFPHDLTAVFTNAGCEVLEWSGVRIDADSDDRLVSDVPAGELQKIIDSEYQLGHDPAQKHRGQMLHFIAQKD